MELLGGEVDFSVVSGFEVNMEVYLTLAIVNVNGVFFLGGRGAVGTYCFKQVFPSDIDT